MDVKFFLLVCIVVILGPKASTSEIPGCGGLDIVFLLDTSRSIWGPHFRDMLKFVNNMVDQFDIGRESFQTRIGVILFGRRCFLQFFLNTYFNKYHMRRAIKYIRHKYDRSTNIGAALECTSRYMFKQRYGSRKNATHIAIVVTDGKSQDPKSTRNFARQLKESGVQIFALGVGRNVKRKDLIGIASHPHEHYVFTVDKFKALKSIKYKLPSSACEATTTSTTTTTTTTSTTTTTTPTTTTTVTTTSTPAPTVPLSFAMANRVNNLLSKDYLQADDPVRYCGGKNADIFFILDASNSIWPEHFKKEKQFVNDLIDIFDISENKTRIGLVVYSTDVHPKVVLNSRFSKEQLKQKVNELTYVSGRTNTSDAIEYVRTEGFAPELKRNHSVRIGIVVTDGISRDPLATKRQSQLARADGIHLFAIGIGDKIDKTELKRIANDPDDKFLFHVSSFGTLTSIKNLLALTACGVLVDAPSNLMKVCGHNSVMDVVFVYDTAAMGNEKSQITSYFIYDAVRHFDISRRTIQVGRLTENCPANSNIDLTASDDLSAFHRIDFPGFYNILRNLHSSFSWRSYANQLAVLVIDENTQNIDDIIRFLRAYVNHKVMIIAVGDKTMHGKENLLTDRHRLVRIKSYEDMISSKPRLMENLCEMV